MNDRPVGERITAVEVSLKQHLYDCQRKSEKNFRTQLVILTALIGVLAKVFGLV